MKGVMTLQGAFLEPKFLRKITVEDAASKQRLDQSLVGMVTYKAFRFASSPQFLFRDDHIYYSSSQWFVYLKTGKDYSSLREIQHLTFVAVADRRPHVVSTPTPTPMKTGTTAATTGHRVRTFHRLVPCAFFRAKAACRRVPMFFERLCP